jgi:hypothetical protein
MSMPSQDAPEPRQTQNSPLVEQVSNAHELLQNLRKRIGEHPELSEAILKLETALSILAVKTAGML